MDEDPKPGHNASDLREPAEGAMAAPSAAVAEIDQLSKHEIAVLVHELRVRQVELEMENRELRQAHLELNESLDRYVELYDYAPVGYFTLTRRGVIRAVNLTGSLLVGVARDALMGTPFVRFVHEDCANSFFLHLKHVFETSERSTCDVRLQRQDRSDFEARLETNAVKQSDRAIGECRMIVIDITGHKTVERSLRESEARFRSLFSSVQEGVGIFQPVDDGKDFVLFALNDACAQIWEARRDDAIGRRALDVLPKVNAPELLEVFQRVWTTEKAEAFPVRTYERGKLSKWVDCHVYKLPSDELVMVSRDVTHRRKAEQDTLHRSEERFRAVFESVTLCLFLEDTGLRYTHVNPAAANLLGIPSSQIIGRRAEDIFGEEIGKPISDRHSRVLLGESVEYQQTRIIRGTPLTFSEICVPLRSGDDEIIGVCCVSREIAQTGKLFAEPHIRAEDYPSRAMRETLQMARAAAATDGIVFLQGESGCGKDYFARWIHDHSRRATGPFFSLNCAALPEHLAESELFGHERGAFTGAAVQKKGLLELAEGGTILLNEIGELPLHLQSKLLMFLDTNSFVRLGGQKQVRVEARLMAATHRDLNEELAHGRFLKPLYYRLSVFPIHVPPLRDRIEDIPLLVKEIVPKLVQEMQITSAPIVEPDQLMMLSHYEWPGNVRELRNVIERSLILWSGGKFLLVLPEKRDTEKDWSYTVRHDQGRTLRDVTTEVIGSLCGEVLRRCEGNKTEAARRLDISRDALYRYMRKCGIQP